MHKLYEELIRGLVRLDLDRVDIEPDGHPRKEETPSDKAEDSVRQRALSVGEKRLQPAMSSCSSAFSELFEWFAEDAKRMEEELGYVTDENAVKDKATQNTHQGTEARRDIGSMEGNASSGSGLTRGEEKPKRLTFKAIAQLLEYALDVDFAEHFGVDEESEGEGKKNEGLKYSDEKCNTSLDLDGYEDLHELEVVGLTDKAN